MIIPFPQLCNIYSNDIAKDVFIGPFVEIQKGAKIGKGCRIQSHTFICEGVTIEENCFIGHGVMFVNDLYPPRGAKHWKNTLVRKGSSIGSNATILPCIIDGIVGAGAVVTKSFKGIVKGNPAK